MTFRPLPIENGLLADLSEDIYPAQVFGWNDSDLELVDDATHFGMVTEGGAILHDRQDRFRLRAGMFFVAVDRCRLSAPGGKGLVISRLGYRGCGRSAGRWRRADVCISTAARIRCWSARRAGASRA